jgi:hypothetical protein
MRDLRNSCAASSIERSAEWSALSDEHVTATDGHVTATDEADGHVTATDETPSVCVHSCSSGVCVWGERGVCVGGEIGVCVWGERGVYV